MGSGLVMFTQSYFWYFAQVIPFWGGGGIWKLFAPVRYGFLVVAYKNELQNLWKLLCTRLKLEWKYFRISIIIMKKITEKNIMPRFYSKIHLDR